MKPYIIAALLFVTGFLVLGVLTANLMAPPEPKPQAHAVPPKPEGGYAPTGPAEASYPAAMPTAHPAGMPSMPGMTPTTPGMTPMMPGMASTMPGMPNTGVPPGSGSMAGASDSIGLSATPTISLPKPPAIEPTNPVPIIQPDDLGSDTSPTRGRVHQ